MEILKAKNVGIFYGKKCVLKDVNFSVNAGEIIFITGSSGSGKSTLLTSLNGFLRENGGGFSGEILFHGENIAKMSAPKLRKHISMLFQDSKPFPFSVRKNLDYVSEFYDGKKLSDAEATALLEAVNLASEVGLDDDASKFSGGQKQRLCIARMLSAKPEILLFDEPSSSLDASNARVIEELFATLSARYTIIVSTHDIAMARRLASKIFKIENGKLEIINNKI